MKPNNRINKKSPHPQHFQKSELHGMGSFTVKESAVHNGYNPVTGKAEVFAARKICKFILSKKIRLPEG